MSVVVAVSSMSTGWRVSMRSEEHTSELQSRSDLVCRLLLEKKKTARTGASRSHFYHGARGLRVGTSATKRRDWVRHVVSNTMHPTMVVEIELSVIHPIYP